MSGSQGRATPFHCPYCADEDIRPYEETDGGHGAWECRACLRAFRVTLITHLARPTVTPSPKATR